MPVIRVTNATKESIRKKAKSEKTKESAALENYIKELISKAEIFAKANETLDKKILELTNDIDRLEKEIHDLKAENVILNLSRKDKQMLAEEYREEKEKLLNIIEAIGKITELV